MLGITLETLDNLDEILPKIQNKGIMVRIVGDPDTAAKDIKDSVDKFVDYGIDILMQPVDSSDMSKFTREAHLSRSKDYMDTFGMYPNVKYFEIGNEINGDWLGQGVADKVNDAMAYATQSGVKSMVTMFAQGLEDDPKRMIFPWLEKNPILLPPDLVGLSIYPRAWSHPPDINGIFNGLGALWPKSLLCIGEFGPENGTEATRQEKITMIKTWMGYKPIVKKGGPPDSFLFMPQYVGGGFYWDCAAEMDLWLEAMVGVN